MRPACRALSPKPARDRSVCSNTGSTVWRRSRPASSPTRPEHGTVYLAVDEGVLVKTGADVLVSVRHAIGGTDLGQLHDEIKKKFLTLDREERTGARHGREDGKRFRRTHSRSFNMGDEAKRIRDCFARKVASEEARKLRVQREGSQGVWFGLGMSGLIGWSVAVPTLGGIMLGSGWTGAIRERFSWTLALLFAGLFIGCANAWYWVDQQDKAMHDE